MPAAAQDLPSEAAPPEQEAVTQDDDVEPGEIVVTGSRIARSGFNAPTPVTTLDSVQIEKRAPTTLADILQTIPSFRASTTPATTGITTRTRGGASADLRGLGAGRTLVLVNNRRFVSTGPENTVDLKAIPTMLIRQIEVVTGGASAAWGSDAVAGVVNFILKDRIDGLQASIQSGISEQGDYSEIGGSLAAGTSLLDNRLHFVIGADYNRNRGIGNQYNRDWGREEVGLLTNSAFATNGLPQFIISPDVRPSSLTPGGLITAGPLRGTAFLPNGGTTQFRFGQVFGTSMIGGDNEGQNLTNATDLAVPVELLTTLGRAEFEVSPAFKLYGEVSYAYNRAGGVSQQPRDQGTIVVRRDNAFLPVSVRDRMVALGLQTINVGRVNNDSGPSIAQATNRLFRVVAGASGKLIGDLEWNGYFQYGRNSNFVTSGPNNRITANYTRAIDAVFRPGTNTIVCRSTLTDPANGCLPQNLFGDGSIVVDGYSFGKSFSTVVNKQYVGSLEVSGDIFSTWAGPVSIATGVEYRKESVEGDSDPLSQQIQPSGSIGAFTVGNQFPIVGEYDVREVFGEALVPLLKDSAIARSLDLNGAIRLTDYSTSGSVTTWKVGATWQVWDALRLRATRSRDIRAPNLAELFQDGASSFTNIFDPVVGQTVQIRELARGNPNLLPEKANTWTTGVVLRPTSKLQLSVDYYNVKVADVITAVSANLVAQRCFAGLTEFCSSIVFNPDRSVAFINNQSLNLNAFETSGIDVELSYEVPLGSGDLGIRLLGTYVDKLVTVDSAGADDRVGKLSAFNRTVGVPRFTGVADLNYTLPDFSANLQARMIGEGKYSHNFTEGAGAPNTINDNSIPAIVYLSLSLQKTIKSGEREFQLFGVVNNLLDTDPPFLPSGTVGGANETSTNPTFYDVVGRAFKVGVRVKI